jgi:hypothetical protein
MVSSSQTIPIDEPHFEGGNNFGAEPPVNSLIHAIATALPQTIAALTIGSTPFNLS